MSVAEHIILIQKQLIQELRSILDPITLTDLPLATEFQEDFLSGYLKRTLINEASLIVPGSKPNQKMQQIEYADCHYAIDVRESLQCPDTVEVWFVQRDIDVCPNRPQ